MDNYNNVRQENFNNNNNNQNQNNHHVRQENFNNQNKSSYSDNQVQSKKEVPVSAPVFNNSDFVGGFNSGSNNNTNFNKQQNEFMNNIPISNSSHHKTNKSVDVALVNKGNDNMFGGFGENDSKFNTNKNNMSTSPNNYPGFDSVSVGFNNQNPTTNKFNFDNSGNTNTNTNTNNNNNNNNNFNQQPPTSFNNPPTAQKDEFDFNFEAKDPFKEFANNKGDDAFKKNEFGNDADWDF